MDAADIVREGIHETILFSTASERIMAGVRLIGFTIQQLVELSEKDKALLPELATAIEQLAEATEALRRAHTFADARLLTWQERLPD